MEAFRQRMAVRAKIGCLSLLAFKDKPNIELQSKSGQSPTRYFLSALRKIKAERFVLDGEIVVPLDGTFPFMICCSEFIPRKSGQKPRRG
jgi:hypothetical protein